MTVPDQFMLVEFGLLPGGVARSSTVLRRRCNLPDLGALLDGRGEVPRRPISDKRDAPAWSPARYAASAPGLAPRRIDAVEALTCLVLDVDDGGPLSRLDALGDTSGARWWAHTSWSHTDERPKARILWPLEEPIKRDEWSAHWSAAARWAAAHGVAVDAQCKDPSRAYLLPAERPGQPPPRVWASCPYRRRLRLRDILEAYPPPAARPVPINPYSAPSHPETPPSEHAHGAYMARVEARLALAQPGGRNRAALDAGVALGKRGLPPADTARWTQRLIDAAIAAGLPADEASNAVRSGVRRITGAAP